MNPTQALNDISKQINQLLNEPEADLNRYAQYRLSDMQRKIEKQVDPDLEPDSPQLLIEIESGIVQRVQANRGDIDLTVIDKDLDSEPNYYVQTHYVDQIMFDKTQTIQELTQGKA